MFCVYCVLLCFWEIVLVLFSTSVSLVSRCGVVLYCNVLRIVVLCVSPLVDAVSLPAPVLQLYCLLSLFCVALSHEVDWSPLLWSVSPSEVQFSNLCFSSRRCCVPQSCRAFPSRHSSVAPRPAGREEQTRGSWLFHVLTRKENWLSAADVRKRERIIDRKPIVEMTLSTKCWGRSDN